ncbi:MAG: class I SAM-dependent methyltransferase [Nannocystaceae bacterium]
MAAAHDAERIGPTAHYTAYVWHRLGLPYARHLATRQGAVLYWGFFALGEWTTRVVPGVPTMRGYLAYRHLLIDALVESLGPDRLVELGAGLTPRTLQWALDRGVAAVDIDLAPMIAVKRAALERLPSPLRDRAAATLTLVAADVLAPDFERTLAEQLADARTPVVVAEGLASYFDLPARVQLFATVAAALRRRGGGHFVVDLHTADAQAHVGGATTVLRQAIRMLTRRRHALDPFPDQAALRAALLQAGFADARRLQPQDWVARAPALARLRSPAHVVHAWV